MFSFLTNVKQKFRTMEFLGGYLKHEQTFILNISLAKLDVDIMDIIWTKVGHAIMSLDPNNLQTKLGQKLDILLSDACQIGKKLWTRKYTLDISWTISKNLDKIWTIIRQNLVKLKLF